MTVRLETTIHRFIGLSGDAKPEPGQTLDGQELTAADVPVGSIYLNADTAERWHWTGREWRAEDVPEVRELKVATTLLREAVNELITLRHALMLGGLAAEIDEPIK